MNPRLGVGRAAALAILVTGCALGGTAPTPVNSGTVDGQDWLATVRLGNGDDVCLATSYPPGGSTGGVCGSVPTEADQINVSVDGGSDRPTVVSGLVRQGIAAVRIEMQDASQMAEPVPVPLREALSAYAVGFPPDSVLVAVEALDQQGAVLQRLESPR